MPTNKKSSGSGINASQWMKNAGKSLYSATKDYVSNNSPTVAMLASGATKGAKQVGSLFKNAKQKPQSSQQIGSTISKIPMLKDAKDELKKYLGSLRRGNLFGNLDEGSDDVSVSTSEEKDSGTFFGSEDDEYDFDFSPEINVNTGAAQLQESMAYQTEATVKAMEANINANVATTAASIAQQQQATAAMVDRLDAINSSLGEIINFNQSVLSESLEKLKTFFDERKGDENSFTSASEDKTPFSRNGNTGKYTGIDTTKYVSLVKAQLKESTGALGMLGDFIGPLLDKESAVGGMDILSSVITGFITDGLFSRTIAKPLARLETAVGEAIPRLLMEFSDMGKQSDNKFVQMFGKIFGYNVGTQSHFDIGGIEATKVDFDKQTKHAITSVIPRYLSEISEYTKAITQKVLNVDDTTVREIGDQAKVFDYSSGTFKTKDSINKELLNSVVDTLHNEFNSSVLGKQMSEFASRNADNIKNDDEKEQEKQRKELLQSYEQMNKLLSTFMYQQGERFDFVEASKEDSSLSKAFQELGLNKRDIQQYLAEVAAVSTRNDVKKDSANLQYSLNLSGNRVLDEIREDPSRYLAYDSSILDEDNRNLDILSLYGKYGIGKNKPHIRPGRIRRVGSEDETEDDYSGASGYNNGPQVNQAILSSMTEQARGSDEAAAKGFGGRFRQTLIDRSSGAGKALLSGDIEGFVQTLAGVVAGAAATTAEFIGKEVVTPAVHFLVGNREESGFFKDGLFAGFSNKVVEFGKRMQSAITGDDWVDAEGTKHDGDKENSLIGSLKGVGTTVKTSVKSYLFGETQTDSLGVETKKDGILTKFVDYGKDLFTDIKGNITGLMYGKTENMSEAEKKEYVANVNKKLQGNTQNAFKGMGLGALGAFALRGGWFQQGLLTGAIVNPIAMAGIGAVAGFISNNNVFQKYLFGGEYIDKNGKAQYRNGLIPKSTQEYFTKNKHLAIGGAALGALKSMVFPSSFGFLGNLLAGPAAGAAVGMAGGLLKNSKMFQNFLFGDESKGTTGIVQMWKGIWNGGPGKGANAGIGKEAGKSLGYAALGGLAGKTMGSILASQGFLGSMLTPLGPIGGAVLGVAGGIALSKDHWNELLFGKDIVDSKGKVIDRKQGIFGRVAATMSLTLFHPVRDASARLVRSLGYTLEHKILDPVRLAFQPIGMFVKNLMSSVWTRAKRLFTSIGSSIKKNFLDPLRFVVTQFTRPLATGFKMFTKVLSAGAGAIGSVFKTAVGAVGGALRGSLTPEQRRQLDKNRKEAKKKATEDRKKMRDERRAEIAAQKNRRTIFKQTKGQYAEDTEENRRRAEMRAGKKIRWKGDPAVLGYDGRYVKKQADEQHKMQEEQNKNTKNILETLKGSITHHLREINRRLGGNWKNNLPRHAEGTDSTDEGFAVINEGENQEALISGGGVFIPQGETVVHTERGDQVTSGDKRPLSVRIADFSTSAGKAIFGPDYERNKEPRLYAYLRDSLQNFALLITSPFRAVIDVAKSVWWVGKSIIKGYNFLNDFLKKAVINLGKKAVKTVVSGAKNVKGFAKNVSGNIKYARIDSALRNGEEWATEKYEFDENGKIVDKETGELLSETLGTRTFRRSRSQREAEVTDDREEESTALAVVENASLAVVEPEVVESSDEDAGSVTLSADGNAVIAGVATVNQTVQNTALLLHTDLVNVIHAIRGEPLVTTDDLLNQGQDADEFLEADSTAELPGGQLLIGTDDDPNVIDVEATVADVDEAPAQLQLPGPVETVTDEDGAVATIDRTDGLSATESEALDAQEAEQKQKKSLLQIIASKVANVDESTSEHKSIFKNLFSKKGLMGALAVAAIPLITSLISGKSGSLMDIISTIGNIAKATGKAVVSIVGLVGKAIGSLGFGLNSLKNGNSVVDNMVEDEGSFGFMKATDSSNRHMLNGAVARVYNLKNYDTLGEKIVNTASDALKPASSLLKAETILKPSTIPKNVISATEKVNQKNVKQMVAGLKGEAVEVTSASDNSKVWKWISEGIDKISNFITSKYSGSKVSSLVSGLKQAVLGTKAGALGTKLKQVVAKYGGKIIGRIVGSTGFKVATAVVTVGLSSLGQIALEGLNGLTGAARLFHINQDDVDTTMMIISTAIGALKGTTIGMVFDMVSEYCASIFGFDLLSEIAKILYTFICEVTGNDEALAKFEKASDDFKEGYENYKSSEKAKQYMTYLATTGQSAKDVTLEEYLQQVEEGTLQAVYDSEKEYNEKQNKTLFSSIGDGAAALWKGISGAVGWVGTGLFGNNETILVDDATHTVYRKIDGAWHLYRFDGEKLVDYGEVLESSIPETAKLLDVHNKSWFQGGGGAEEDLSKVTAEWDAYEADEEALEATLAINVNEEDASTLADYGAVNRDHATVVSKKLFDNSGDYEAEYKARADEVLKNDKNRDDKDTYSKLFNIQNADDFKKELANYKLMIWNPADNLYNMGFYVLADDWKSFNQYTASGNIYSKHIDYDSVIQAWKLGQLIASPLNADDIMGIAEIAINTPDESTYSDEEEAEGESIFTKLASAFSAFVSSIFKGFSKLLSKEETEEYVEETAREALEKMVGHRIIRPVGADINSKPSASGFKCECYLFYVILPDLENAKEYNQLNTFTKDVTAKYVQTLVQKGYAMVDWESTIDYTSDGVPDIPVLNPEDMVTTYDVIEEEDGTLAVEKGEDETYEEAEKDLLTEEESKELEEHDTAVVEEAIKEEEEEKKAEEGRQATLGDRISSKEIEDLYWKLYDTNQAGGTIDDVMPDLINFYGDKSIVDQHGGDDIPSQGNDILMRLEEELNAEKAALEKRLEENPSDKSAKAELVLKNAKWESFFYDDSAYEKHNASKNNDTEKLDPAAAISAIAAGGNGGFGTKKVNIRNVRQRGGYGPIESGEATAVMAKVASNNAATAKTVTDKTSQGVIAQGTTEYRKAQWNEIINVSQVLSEYDGSYWIWDRNTKFRHFNYFGQSLGEEVDESIIYQKYLEGNYVVSIRPATKISTMVTVLNTGVKNVSLSQSNAMLSATYAGTYSNSISSLMSRSNNLSSNASKITSSRVKISTGNSVNATASTIGTTNKVMLAGGYGDKLNGVPYYSQNDSRWKDRSYSDGTDSAKIGEAGCGPTALAMVASHFTGGNGGPILPTDLASLAQETGYRDQTGTNWDFIGDASAGILGLNTEQVINPTPDIIAAELSRGEPVILSGVRSTSPSKSPYTSSGHYVVGTGLNSDGTVNISDPRGKQYSGRYKLSDIANDTGSVWGFGGYGKDILERVQKKKRSAYGGFGSLERWLAICVATKAALAAPQPGYNQGGFIPISVGGKTVICRQDCSGYVSACLDYYGVIPLNARYCSADFTNGGVMNGTGFSKHPWTGWATTQPGDIVTRIGHVAIMHHFDGVNAWVLGCGSSASLNDPNPRTDPSSYTYIWRPGPPGAGAVNAGEIGVSNAVTTPSTPTTDTTTGATTDTTAGTTGDTAGVTDTTTGGSTTTTTESYVNESKKTKDFFDVFGSLMGEVGARYTKGMVTGDFSDTDYSAAFDEIINGPKVTTTTDTAGTTGGTTDTSGGTTSSGTASSGGTSSVAATEGHKYWTVGDYVGHHVKPFESGKAGIHNIAHAGADWGMSYGSYGLTLRFGNVTNFLKRFYPDLAANLYYKGAAPAGHNNLYYPGPAYVSPISDVTNVWNAAIARDGADKFFEHEHHYIEDIIYEPALSRAASLGYNPDATSRLAQEAMWSWAVRVGPDTAAIAANRIGLQTGVSDDVILQREYDYRYGETGDGERYLANPSWPDNSERVVLGRDVKNKPPLIGGAGGFGDYKTGLRRRVNGGRGNGKTIVISKLGGMGSGNSDPRLLNARLTRQYRNVEPPEYSIPFSDVPYVEYIKEAKKAKTPVDTLPAKTVIRPDVRFMGGYGYAISGGRGNDSLTVNDVRKLLQLLQMIADTSTSSNQKLDWLRDIQTQQIMIQNGSTPVIVPVGGDDSSSDIGPSRGMKLSELIASSGY